MQSKTGAWEGGWESHESAVARGRPAVALRDRQRRTRKRNCCCLDEPDLRVNHAKGKWRTSLGWWFPLSGKPPLCSWVPSALHMLRSAPSIGPKTDKVAHTQQNTNSPHWIRKSGVNEVATYHLWLLKSSLLRANTVWSEDSSSLGCCKGLLSFFSQRCLYCVRGQMCLKVAIVKGV